MNRPITKVKYIVCCRVDDMEYSINQSIEQILKDDIFDVIDIKHGMSNDGGRYISSNYHSAMLLLSPKIKALGKK